MLDLEDDSQLLLLAREPRRDLLPILDRADAMSPLIFLLAFIPVLAAIPHQTVEDVDAAWGLESLEAVSNGIIGVVDRTNAGRVRSFGESHCLPVGLCLTSASFGLLHSTTLFWLYLPTYCAVAVLVGSVYVFMREVGGPRLALVTSTLLVLHAPVLLLAQTAVSGVWSLPLALVTYYCVIGHLHRSGEIVSGRLLCGGVALGLCLLADETTAIVSYVTLAMYWLFQVIFVGSPRQKATKPLRGLAAIASCLSMIILALTATAAGGWREWAVYTHDGQPFWAHWQLVPMTVEAITNDSAPGGIQSSLARIVWLFQALAGLIVFGFVCVVRSWANGSHRHEAIRKQNKSAIALVAGDTGLRELNVQVGPPPIDHLSFLVIWMLVAMTAWIAIRFASESPPVWRDLGALQILFPAVGLAAHGFDQIVRRRTSVVSVLLVVIATILVLVLGHCTHYWSIKTCLWASLLTIATASLLVWVIRRKTHVSEFAQRSWLAMSLCLLVIANSAIGFGAASQPRIAADSQCPLCFLSAEPPRDIPTQRDSREGIPLKTISHWIDQFAHHPIDNGVLVCQPNQSYAIEFALRSAWPDADWQILSNVDAAMTAVSAKRRPYQAADSMPAKQVALTLVVVHGSKQDERRFQTLTMSADAEPAIRIPPQIMQGRLVTGYIFVDHRAR